MIRLALLASMALLASRDAHASPACSGPWNVTYTPAVGCPLVWVARDYETGIPSMVEVRRNGERVFGATATIESTQIDLDVDYYECGSSGVAYVESEPFVRYQIEITGAEAGDEVYVDYLGTQTLSAPGPCGPSDYLPSPECYSWKTTCEGDDIVDDSDSDAGGCSTTGDGAGPAALFLALFGLVGWRRRRDH
jgi:MYXO-CTERM domain-containing protein